MRFPNALEGVKKIYKAEIIGLIGALIGFVAAILALAGVSAGEDGLGLVAVGAILIIAMAVLLVISFIMNLVGLNKAKPDEVNFKNALTMVIIGIIAGILLGATKEGTLLNSIGDNLSKVCGLLANYFVCNALINLAGQLGDEAMAKKAGTIQSMLLGVWCAAVVLNVLGDILQRNATLSTIAAVIGLVAAVVEIVAYILYIGLLKRSRGMLEA